MAKHNTRAEAVKVLLLVVNQGFSFQPSLVSKICPHLSPQDMAFVSYLCFGVLRFYFQIQKTLSFFLKKPLKEKDVDLNLLLFVGVYQLYYTDIKPFAAINETVEATLTLKKPFAKGLVNGVLREALRQKEALIAKISLDNSHPSWMIAALKKAWPNQWQDIVKANLSQPPFNLRVNRQKISRQDYLELLKKQGLKATLSPFSDVGLTLEEGVAVDKLPGFSEGFVSVQDAAAQLVAPLLELKPNLRVLDACAAPGGKMAHILETEPNLELTAVEKDPDRFPRLLETKTRLNLKAELFCEDCENPDKWFDHKLFDRILIDAPCSATGVVRRHPDIMLHRRSEDIAALAKHQANILAKLWPLLKVNGILLYVTCSLLPEENEEQIKQFLQNHSDATLLPIQGNWGSGLNFGRQILPGETSMDGFYFAKIVKMLLI